VNHFLDTADWSTADLWDLLKNAVALKTSTRRRATRRCCTQIAAMVFQKPSLRTRVSFEMAMQHVGGYASTSARRRFGLGKRESIADIARAWAAMSAA